MLMTLIAAPLEREHLVELTFISSRQQLRGHKDARPVPTAKGHVGAKTVSISYAATATATSTYVACVSGKTRSRTMGPSVVRSGEKIINILKAPRFIVVKLNQGRRCVPRDNWLRNSYG